MIGDEIVRPCDRHSNETVTIRKHVSKYENMQKWMIKFLRKFEDRGIKIDLVNSILILKSINLQFIALILYGVGVRPQLIYREVCGNTYTYFHIGLL